jgi:hydroxymethylbilane synthase
MTLRIGSRGSKLALWQAEHVAGLLRRTDPGLEISIEVITTTGDRMRDAPLAKIGGKGLFTKEIEQALMDGRIDLAVHSLKDLPTSLPDGLALGSVLSRHDPSDALVSPSGRRFHELPEGARIGTSSLRREAQLKHVRPDLVIESLRGNVPTRVEKTESEGLDAAVLARAGLERLGLAGKITEVLPAELVLPAPGQGALGIELREDDAVTRQRLLPLQNAATRAATDAERAMLQALGGGCQIPVGALARPVPPDSLLLEGMVAEPSGKQLIRARHDGPLHSPAAIGRALAHELIEQGAGAILEELGGGLDAEQDRA